MALNTREEKCGELFFRDLCAKFEKMQKFSKSQQKLSLVFNQELKNFIKGESLFPLLRLLLPLNDTGRQKYGIKQAVVATTYIEALQLNKSSADASRLKFWKNPTKLNAAVSRVGSGDFCSILEDVLRSRISIESSTHTLSSVNAILDDLARTSGQKEKVELIRSRILNSFSAVEQKWLMRIVFQDMKIGLKYEQVLNYLAPNALQRYNECSDLRKVCAEIASGSLGSSASSDPSGTGTMFTSGISVFTCFHPMLAKGFPNTGQIVEVEKSMRCHPFLMDLKLDGERMLCHVSDGKGMFWSRNGNDYSDTYRALCDDVVGSVNCSACILDGEVCAWDDDTNKFIPFGHNRTVARMEDDQLANSLSGLGEDDGDGLSSGGGGSCRLVYVLFDVLYVEGLRKDGLVVHDVGNIISVESVLARITSLNDECRKDCIQAFDRAKMGSGAGDILHLPLCVRREILPHVVRLRPKRIELVRSEAVYSCSPSDRKSRLEVFFNKVSQEGEEGLVVKDGLSPYLLGMRSRQALFWVKMKPEYSDMTRDLDLIILGAYYGEGQSMRGKGLSTFLCGVRDDTSEGMSQSSVSTSQSQSSFNGVRYKSLCKVGTGYNFAELETLRTKLKNVIVPWDTTNKQHLPPHFSSWKIGKNDDVPDVWIRPADSVVVELKCAEIVTSTQFSAGITCRFPRLRKIRYDKNIEEVMTVSAVEEVMRNPRMDVSEAASRRKADGPSKLRGRKKNTDTERFSLKYTGSKVASQFMVPKFAEDVKNVGCACAEMVFCVLENQYTIPAECDVTHENGAGLLEMTGGDRSGQLTRQQVIRLIQTNGGIVVASPVAGAIIVTGDKRTLQSKSMIEAGKNDVVHFRFVVDLLIGASDGTPNPSHLLGCTHETKRQFAEKYDSLGDSYVDAITESRASALLRQLDDTFLKWDESLATTLASSMKKRKVDGKKPSGGAKKKRTTGETENKEERNESMELYKRIRVERNWRDIAINFLDDSESEIFLDSSDVSIFWRNKTLIYLDIHEDVGRAGTAPDALNETSIGANQLFFDRPLPAHDTDMLSLLPLLQLHGAFVSRDLSADVTHIVMDPRNMSRKELIQDRLRELRVGCTYRHEKRIVTPSWVHDCIDKKSLLIPTKSQTIEL